MAKETIGKPLEVGGRRLPLSPAVRANGFLFLSGALGTDDTLRLVGDDVATQTRQALANLCATLGECGCGFEDVVKVTAFLTDAKLAPEFNAAYAESFPDQPPARSTVVSGLLIPGALVEIEAIAVLPEGG